MRNCSRSELMSVVRARTENQSWLKFYSDLLGQHSLHTVLLTLARLRQSAATAGVRGFIKDTKISSLGSLYCL